MGKLSGRNIGRGIVAGFLLFLMLGAYGAAITLHSRTLVSWWIPLPIAFCLAALTGIVMWKSWRWLTDSGSFILNYICHVVFSCGIFLTAIYGLNFCFSHEDTAKTQQVTVERKYTKTRHHQKRVSRRVYTQGAPYYVYYFRLRFEDGTEKDINVQRERYNRTRYGSTITLSTQTGLFGIPVIKPYNSI